MAMPARAQTFALEDCRDLLRKLDREVRRFASCKVPDDRIDHAFNAAVTAWHLCDWVFNDMNEEQRARILDKPHDIEAMREKARTGCRAIYMCRYVATASKHWIVDRRPDHSVGVVTTAKPSHQSTG